MPDREHQPVPAEDVMQAMPRAANENPGVGAWNPPLSSDFRCCLQPLAVPPQANGCWSVDLMHDSPSRGQRFRMFDIADDSGRECPASGVECRPSCCLVMLHGIAFRQGEYLSVALWEHSWAMGTKKAASFLQLTA